MTISESLANITTLGLSDSISISEGLAKAWDAELDISDSISFAEEVDPVHTPSGAEDYEKDLFDSLIISESLARSVTFFLSLFFSQ